MITLLHNISRLVTMNSALGSGPLGIIEKAALVFDEKNILWCGQESAVPPEFADAQKIDAQGNVVCPGLIDCHTHIIHAGTRQHEFAARAAGKTYLEIAQAGGGIMSTVRATRAASEDELFQSACERIKEAMSFGTTIFEIKTGYGLDVETELKLVRVLNRLQQAFPGRIFGTFLGTHVVPIERKHERAAYVQEMLNLLPEIAAQKICDAVDIFVEETAFTRDEALQFCKAAKKLGLKIRLHVDQFADHDGGKLAAELGASNADHLDYLSESGMEAMLRENVAAVVLPGASFFAGKKYPPARKMCDKKLTVAIATDYNPGTNPSLNLWLMGTIAAAQMGMSLDEVWQGITVNAAKVLGIAESSGKAAPGYRPDLVLLDAPDEYFPLYRYGKNCVRGVVLGGKYMGP